MLILSENVFKEILMLQFSGLQEFHWERVSGGEQLASSRTKLT